MSKIVDLLDEDKPIAGQKFVCVSFISPDKILKKKELFLFENFLKHFDFEKSMKKFQQFLNFTSYKYNLNFDNVIKDFEEFVKSEHNNLIDTSIEDEYKNFLDNNEENLQKKFNEENNFQTNVKGVKIRGCFQTQQEAEQRCKFLREQDPNHDIYVGPVGMWMPWEPEAYKTGKVEYLEEELNKLMHEKQNNEEKAKQEFDARVKETKEKAIEENKKIAIESGNKLTQNIDDDGNLYKLHEVDMSEENEVNMSNNLKKELFDKENKR
jgi:hypothetical protein